MIGYRSELTTERDLQTNQGIARDYIDDDYYKVRITSDRWTNLANGAVIGRKGASPALILPKNGLQSLAFYGQSRPRFWEKGNMRVTLIYTGDTASTNNSRIGGDSQPTDMGGVFGVGFAPFIASLPGPAVAWTELEFTYATLLSVDALDRFLALDLYRLSGDAADTYAGEIYIFEALLEFVGQRGE